MKKTSIILCALAAGLLPGCNDDADTPQPQVTVADINFKAAAAEGYILLGGQAGTASVSDDWCTLRQSGDTVFVSVGDNLSIEGRNTVVTVAFADGTQRQVPVNQQGAFFRIDQSTALLATDSADVLSLPVASSFDYTVEVANGWVSYEPQDEAVALTFEKNLTGAPRHTTVTVACPKLNKQFTAELYQYSVDDLMGQWTASFTNSRNQQASCTVTLAKDATNDSIITVAGMPEGLVLKARMTDSHTFAFRLGEDLGFFQGSFKIYIDGISDGGKVYSSDTEKRKIGYVGNLKYNGNYECTFTADSTFSDGTAMGGIAVTAYEANGNKMGTVESFRQLRLSR